MKYMNFDPQIHDAQKIATLKYNVDFRTYDRLFGSRQKAIASLVKSLKNDKTLRVIYDGEDIIGILNACNYYNQQRIHFITLKLFIVEIMDHFVICNIEKDDIYIGEIAIDENHRSKGYGTRVINDVIDHARKKGYKRVILDADFRNPKAKALYERLGFKVYRKKSFFFIGMYNMEYIIL